MEMVDLGEQTREHFEEPDISLPTSTIGYYHAGIHHTSRNTSVRPSVQTPELASRHDLLDLRQDIVPVKSDPENLSKMCSISNTLPVLSTGSSLSAETIEDNRIKGQLLQEITRAAESFEPYNVSSATSSGYRNYNLVPEMPQSSEADYMISDAPQWIWSRGDDRAFSGSVTNNVLVGSVPVNENTLASLQYPMASQLVSDSFPSSLPTLSESEAQLSISSSNSMMQRMQSSTLAMTSALDLSPASPVQTSSLMPHTSQVPSVSSNSQHILQPQNLLGSFDSVSQQQPLSYRHTLEENLSIAANNADEEEEENADDVEPYQTEFKCDNCGLLCSHLQHLKDHAKQCSNTLGSSELNTPNENSELTNTPDGKAKRCLRQQTTQRSFSCKHCDETFSRPERLKVHELNHSGERPYRCNECSSSFTTKTMLARHKKIHTGEKPYFCGECKTSFTESGSLKVHMRLHTGDRPYKCDWCSEAFSGAGMLASHKRKHTGEKPYTCSDCGASFRLLSTLKSHSRRHTGEKPFACDLCGNSFSQKAALRRHKKTHLNIKPYECDLCGLKFREKETLRRHIALHNIKFPFVCDICGAGFNYAKKLENHKMLHNGGDKPYQCNKCPSSFASPKYLTQHKRRVHDRKGSIRCKECSATFNRKESLRSHSRIHKGSAEYSCEYCGASFNLKAMWTRHLKVHVEKTPVNANSSKETFTCKLCKVEFLDKPTLESHIMDHRTVEDNAYNCPSCNLGFSDQLELVKHKRTQHPSQRSVPTVPPDTNDDNNEPVRDKYVCEDCDQAFFRKRQLRAHRKYCLCRDFDALDEPLEVKPNIASQTKTTSKGVNAMKLVSAVLAAAGSNSSDVPVNYQEPPKADHPTHNSIAVSSSSAQLSQLYTSNPLNILQDLPYQEPTQESLLHQSANIGMMQSQQESLRDSIQDLGQQVSRTADLQGTHSQHSLQEDEHHHHQSHHNFDLDISQNDFYKSALAHQTSNHHLGHRYDQADSSHESLLLQNSVLQSISQDLEACGDLHSGLRHSENFVNNREHFKGDQQRILHHLNDDEEEYELDSFHQQDDYHSQFQPQFHSYNQYREQKIPEKYINNTEQEQHYSLQDHTDFKVRHSCPKSVEPYVSMRSKY